MRTSAFPTMEILRLLRETELSVNDIAAKAGCTPSNITQRVKGHFQMTPSQYRLLHGWLGVRGGQRAIPPSRIQKVLDLYDEGMSMLAIERQLSMSQQAVKRCLEHGGREVREGSHYLRSYLPEEEIIDRYKAGESCVDLGRAYGVHEKTVRMVLKAHKVPRRDLGGRIEGHSGQVHAECLRRHKGTALRHCRCGVLWPCQWA